jgi:hypothetical protein
MSKVAEQEQIIRTLSGVQFDRERHGSLYDRGSADSYYHRGIDPHWFPEGSYKGAKITNLTTEEIAEYRAGYDWNEQYGDKKDWG